MMAITLISSGGRVNIILSPDNDKVIAQRLGEQAKKGGGRLASEDKKEMGPWGEDGMPVYEPIPVSEKAAYGSCMMAQNLAVNST